MLQFKLRKGGEASRHMRTSIKILLKRKSGEWSGRVTELGYVGFELLYPVPGTYSTGYLVPGRVPYPGTRVPGYPGTVPG